MSLRHNAKSTRGVLKIEVVLDWHVSVSCMLLRKTSKSIIRVTKIGMLFSGGNNDVVLSYRRHRWYGLCVL